MNERLTSTQWLPFMLVRTMSRVEVTFSFLTSKVQSQDRRSEGRLRQSEKGRTKDETATQRGIPQISLYVKPFNLIPWKNYYFISPMQRDQIKRSRSIEKVLVDRLTWSTGKWKEMGHIYKRSVSFRRNSCKVKERLSGSLNNDESRNLMNNHYTISGSRIKQLNPIHSEGLNEYDDK